MLSVRGHLDLEGGLSLRAYALFLEGGAVGEIFVILIGESALVDAPAAVSFRSVVKLPAVLGETYAALLLGGIGDSARGGVVYAGYKDVSSYDKCNLFSVRGNRHGRSAFHLHLVHGFFGFVAKDGNGHLIVLAALYGIEFSVVGVAHRTVICHGKETGGILVIGGEPYLR